MTPQFKCALKVLALAACVLWGVYQLGYLVVHARVVL